MTALIIFIKTIVNFPRTTFFPPSFRHLEDLSKKSFEQNFSSDTIFFIPSQTVLGKIVHRPAKLDKKLARELKALADPTQDAYETVSGKTMCTYDFYEGQGRLDGAFCEFTEQDKMEYLEKLRDFGVVNIEMEGKIV